jgi:hypothetical protein
MNSLPVAVLAVLLLPALAVAADNDRPLVPSITVVGSDHVSAKPDMAEITVGVLTEDPVAGQALKANNVAMEELLKFVAGRGIAEKDVQTTAFNVSPQYQHDPKGQKLPRLVGYQVSNQVRVKIRQLALLGPVLDEVVGKGANQVHGIGFSVAEPTGLLDEARKKAMDDARRKAELYANAAGVTLGRVLLIQEQTPHIPVPRQMFTRSADGGAVPVAAGELEFHASITVTYAIK